MCELRPEDDFKLRLRYFLGLNIPLEKTNKYSDVGSLFRPLTPFEISVIQKKIDQVYNTFLSKVSDGRGLSHEQIDEIGETFLPEAFHI